MVNIAARWVALIGFKFSCKNYPYRYISASYHWLCDYLSKLVLSTSLHCDSHHYSYQASNCGLSIFSDYNFECRATDHLSCMQFFMYIRYVVFYTKLVMIRMSFYKFQ